MLEERQLRGRYVRSCDRQFIDVDDEHQLNGASNAGHFDSRGEHNFSDDEVHNEEVDHENSAQEEELLTRRLRPPSGIHFSPVGSGRSRGQPFCKLDRV